MFLVTCDVFFDLMNLADGVVASEHVEVEGLGVFANTCPCADVRSGPPSGQTHSVSDGTLTNLE